MSLDRIPKLTWRHVWQVLWRLRFVYAALAILGGAAWLVYPLRDASALPAPPLPLYTPEPPDLQETLVLGPTVYAPGTQGAVRVLVRDPRSGQPIPGTAVRVALAPREHPDDGQVLYAGQTDAYGTAEIAFQVPLVSEGEWTLVVDAAGRVGTQRVVREVMIRREVHLYLATDKLIYHPGETVHAQLLALGKVDRHPAVNQTVSLTVFDARSNRICTETTRTSAYGAAHGICGLADLVKVGTYRLVATLGEATVECAFTVEPQPSDTLRVDVRPQRFYYQPDQRGEVLVMVRNAHDRAVGGASVELIGTLGADAVEAFRVRGQTDDSGTARVVVHWDRASLVAAGVDPAPLHVVARATDASGQTGSGKVWVPISSQAFWISAWPESGALKPGIENLVLVRVTDPGGRPVQCDLTVALPDLERTVQTRSDATGLARVSIVPTTGSAVLDVTARDAEGLETHTRFSLAVESQGHHLLLRPGRSAYRPGDTAQIEVYAPDGASAVYMDLNLGGQAVATYASPVTDGRARFDVVLPEDISGLLELDAYALLPDGVLARDARQVAVGPSHSLQVTVLPEGRSTGGGPVSLGLRVVDETGRGVQGRASVSVLSGGVVDVSMPGQVASSTPAATHAADLAPQQANVVSKDRPVPESVRRQFEGYKAAWTARRWALTTVVERTLWAWLVLPAMLWMVVLVGGRQRMRSVGYTMLGSVLALPFVLLSGVLLAYLGQKLLQTGAILALAMSWFGVSMALVVRSWAYRDGAALLILSLVLATVALSLGSQYALDRGAVPALTLTAVRWASYAVILLALWTYGAASAREGEWKSALSVFAVVLLLACTWIGCTLRQPGPEVPVEQALPETTHSAAPPAPTPLQLQAPLIMSLPSGEPPFFPVPWSGKTVYWLPDAQTDVDGRLTLTVPLAETTESARVYALALSDDGVWGVAEAELQVPESLSIEPALPVELTVGDELDLPVVIDNATPVSQTVQFTTTQASWFRFRRWGYESQRVIVPPAETRELVLPIQVREWGRQVLTLTVQADAWSGVITHPVSVQPNAMPVAFGYSWWTDDRVSYKVRIPWAAVQNTDQIAVKLYSGDESVLSEAGQRASRQMGRAFDQLAAGMEARLLYATYLGREGRGEDEQEASLMHALTADYQRLLAFEVPEGGFSAFGKAPADLYRTATGLRCLSQLAAFYPVDTGLLDQAALWLLRQEQREGTWQPASLPPSWSTLPRPELPLTAYVTWSLVDAGYGDTSGVRSAAAYLERYLDQVQDPYALALVANALISLGDQTDTLGAALARLADQAEIREGLAWWPSRMQSLSGASGWNVDEDGYRTPSIKVETAALATLALSRAQAYPERVAQGLAMLTDSRDVSGTWSAPQTTALALRAYLYALPEAAEIPVDVPSSTVRVTVGETASDPVVLSRDAGSTVVFTELAKGYNDVEIASHGGELAYQIVGSYSLPWNQVSSPSPDEEAVSIEVSYDHTSVTVGETITATVGVMLNRPGVAPLVSLELGLPPGLVLVTSDLDDLVAQDTIAHYERAGARVQVYLLNLESAQPVRFAYHLRAQYPVSVATQPTFAFDVANPQRPAVRGPVRIEVVGE